MSVYPINKQFETKHHLSQTHTYMNCKVS
uniref:Uncharacterized protein n=1 Tax=Anguilla anguilla TaxID=7936 RepID=A0A0E9XS93_ANGAN